MTGAPNNSGLFSEKKAATVFKTRLSLKEKVGGLLPYSGASPHKKINQFLTNIDQCLNDISRF